MVKLQEGNTYMKFIKANTIEKGIAPCPFCGEKEEIYIEEYEHTAGIRYRILCTACMAGIDRGYDQHYRPLIDVWNKRV